MDSKLSRNGSLDKEMWMRILVEEGGAAMRAG